MPNEYRDIAKFYDLIHTPHDVVSTVKLVSSYLKKNSRVLELACGTGIFTAPLARLGFNITGLDNSADMLRLARERFVREKVSVPLIESDMASFDGVFDAILIFTSSLCYLDSQEAMESALRYFSKHLSSGGLLWVDLPNQQFEIADLNNSMDVQKVALDDGELVFVQQIYLNDKWCADWFGFVRDSSGVWSFKHESYEVLYDRERLLNVLKEDFSVSLLGRSDGGIFSSDSPRCVFVAIKN